MMEQDGTDSFSFNDKQSQDEWMVQKICKEFEFESEGITLSDNGNGDIICNIGSVLINWVQLLLTFIQNKEAK